jgi:hypothetical protein
MFVTLYLKIWIWFSFCGILCVCVCVCARACVRARARVCVCVCVCLVLNLLKQNTQCTYQFTVPFYSRHSSSRSFSHVHLQTVQHLPKYPTIRRLCADFQTVTQPVSLEHLTLHSVHWRPPKLTCIRICAYYVLRVGEVRLGFVVDDVTLWQDFT